jgi:hypothetical protein
MVQFARSANHLSCYVESAAAERWLQEYQTTTASAMIPETATKEQPRTKALAQGRHIQYLLVGLGKIHSTIGLSGIAILSIGSVVALSCTIWAIEVGIPRPLAIMVGYCTFVSSACLSAALLVVQNRPDHKKITSATREPTYSAWSLVATLRVSDASRLWCGIEPGCPASQESIAWAQAILDAIKRGELPICERAGIDRIRINQEQANPGWHTQIAREALKAWAQSHGHTPTFLS